jgi:ankyrin repeat protein
VDFWAKGKVTPLMVAVYYKHADCAHVLLEHGASLFCSMLHCAAIPLPSASTALHCAARGGSTAATLEVLKALVCRSWWQVFVCQCAICWLSCPPDPPDERMFLG